MTHPPLKSFQTTKKCIVCRESIDVQALKCTKCQSFQSGWRNSLVFFAGIGGALSLCGAAATFTVASMPELRKSLAWRDELKGVSFDFNSRHPPGHMVIANVGDGDVILTGYSMHRGNGFVEKKFGQLIPAGQTPVIPLQEGPLPKQDPVSVAEGYTVLEKDGRYGNCDSAIDHAMEYKDDCIMVLMRPSNKRQESPHSCVQQSKVTLHAYSLKTQRHFDTEMPLTVEVWADSVQACLDRAKKMKNQGS